MNNQKCIKIIPHAGLCNRLLCLSSAYSISQEVSHSVEVLWSKENELYAFFSDLFCPIEKDNFTIKDSRNPLYKNHSPRHFYIPDFFQKYKFKENYFEEPDFSNYSFFSNTQDYLIYSCKQIGKSENLNKILKPITELENRIKNTVIDFDNVIGLHIRRTDQKLSIQESTDETFINLIKKEIDLNPSQKFYLATDDYTVAEKLKRMFGIRIIHPSYELKRNTIQGMKDAVVDLFCLSKTQKIFGSYASTYSAVASKLGGIELEICR